jgi:hypothetical protein
MIAGIDKNLPSQVTGQQELVQVLGKILKRDPNILALGKYGILLRCFL